MVPAKHVTGKSYKVPGFRKASVHAFFIHDANECRQKYLKGKKNGIARNGQ